MRATQGGRWCLVVLAIANLAIALSLNQGPDWLDAMEVACWFALPYLLGVWAVLGPAPVRWQLPRMAFLLAMVHALGLYGVAIADQQLDVDSVVISAYMLGCLFVIAMLHAALCRVTRGWRITPRHCVDLADWLDRPQRLSLRHLFVDTALAAVGMALCAQLPVDRWRMPGNMGLPVDLSDFGWHLFVANIIVVGGMPWARTILARRDVHETWRWAIVAVLILFVTYGTAWYLTGPHQAGDWMQDETILLMSGYGWFAMNLLLLRGAGYRLVTRREQQSTMHGDGRPLLPETRETAVETMFSAKVSSLPGN